MKTLIRTVVSLSFFLINPPPSQCQQVHSEVPIVDEGGIAKSARVNVAFKENVIPTEAGVTTVDPSKYPIQNSDVRNLLRQLSERYGVIKIRKTIPNSVWGD